MPDLPDKIKGARYIFEFFRSLERSLPDRIARKES